MAGDDAGVDGDSIAGSDDDDVFGLDLVDGDDMVMAVTTNASGGRSQSQ